MKINKETLEIEVQTYNKIVEEIQKQTAILNDLEQKRLKSYGKLEFIEQVLKESAEAEDTKEEGKIEVLKKRKN